VTKALDQSRIEEGQAWLERAQSYLEERNPFYAKLMATRAIGFRGFGRENLTGEQRDKFLELLPEESIEARQAKFIVRGAEDHTPIWRGPIAISHDGNVLRAGAGAFSPNGRLLAAATATTNIGIWNVGTLGEVAIFHGHSNNIAWLEFSPDGQLLASASHDGTIRLWEVGTQRNVAILEGYSGGDDQVLAFSPNGELLAACGEREHNGSILGSAGRPIARHFGQSWRRLLESGFQPRLLSARCGLWQWQC
jgi:hypothetical protein